MRLTLLFGKFDCLCKDDSSYKIFVSPSGAQFGVHKSGSNFHLPPMFTKLTKKLSSYVVNTESFFVDFFGDGRKMKKGQ